MKSQTLLSFVLAAATVAFTACSEDVTTAGQQPTIPASSRTTISDNGFSRSSQPTTRALPNKPEGEKYAVGTSFAQGDSIGIFEVDANGKITQYNKKYVLGGDYWGGPDGSIPYDKTKSYYAYFPYLANDSLAKLGLTTDSEVTAGVTDSEFFANLVSNWKPLNDQSTYEKYNRSDLMISKADNSTITDPNTIHFTMRHTMGLALIELGALTYVVDDDYQWSDSIVATQVHGTYRPWLSNGQLRYIMRPGNEGRVTIHFDDPLMVNVGVKKEEPGSYQSYKVEGKTGFTPTVGDIYCTDGSLYHPKDYTGKKNPLGIVAYVGKDGVSNGYDHGLVLSHHSYVFEKDKWTDPAKFDYSSISRDPSTIFRMMYHEYDGIAKTKAIRALSSDTVPNMIKALDKAPSLESIKMKHSDWFIPSSGQGLHIYEAMSGIDMKSRDEYKSNKEIKDVGYHIDMDQAFKYVANECFQYLGKLYDTKGFITSSLGSNSNKVSFLVVGLSILPPYNTHWIICPCDQASKVYEESDPYIVRPVFAF